MRQIFLLLLTASATWAQSPFPLQIPVRPTSFPLAVPSRPTNVGEIVALSSNSVSPTTVGRAVAFSVATATPFGGGAPSTSGVALRKDGTISTWGAIAAPPDNLTNVVAVANGVNFGLALKGDGTVVGWGYDANGSVSPPSSLTNVVALAASAYSSIALKNDGTVVRWYVDQFVDPSSNPVIIQENLSDVVAIAAGTQHNLALKSDGTIVGFGGVPPSIPPEISDVVALSTGGLALKSDGTVLAFGSSMSSPPAGLTGVGVEAVGGGGYALKADGKLVSWAGPSSPPFITPPPPIPMSLTDVVQVAGGFALTLEPNAVTKFNLQIVGIDIDALTEAIAQRVVAASPDNFGIATKADLGGAISNAATQAITQVQSAPNDYSLYSSTQYEANRITGVAEGKADVTNNPTAYNLFTESSIMDMNMGGLMLKKGTNASALDMELTVETKDNLSTNGWQVAERITRSVALDAPRQFLRVRAAPPYVAPDVKALAHPSLGSILTDAAGNVLYFFSADSPGGNPLYNGPAWPYVAVPASPKADAGISATLASSSFGVQGASYLTVNGRPAYRYTGDTTPGQANGQGIGFVWWTIKANGTIN